MNKDNRVFVTYGNGAFQNARDVLLSLNLDFIKNKSVLIKPNIGRRTSRDRGINTSPEAIAGVIEALQQSDVKEIAIGESPIVGVKTMEAFEKSGVAEVAKRYNIDLIDFDSEKPVVKNIKDARIVDSTKICTPVFRYDCLLSLPVAKTHMHTGITLGIKNLKGCLYRHEKVRYHQLDYKKGKEFEDMTLDTAISDLATILLPDITVIDGYIGMEGLGPSGGKPIKSDFSVASLNPFGADVIGCVMMKQNPKEIAHLRIISERMNFALDPDYYDVSPVDYKDHSVQYNAPPSNISIEYPDVVLHDKESCSACLSTVMLFLRRFKNDMSQYLYNDGKLHIAIGKGIKEDDINEKSILIGNCTRNLQKCGIFVTGCPPVPTRIYEAVTGEEPASNEPEVE